MTGFMRGNPLWRLRKTHGRKPTYATGEDLWDACVEYFEWVAANPLWEVKAFAHHGVVTQAELPKMRAMTLNGLCVHLGVSPESWRNWRADERYAEVCATVDGIIWEHKFTGAAADVLNANLIARDLGLADRSELTGLHGGPIETVALSPETIKADVERLIDAYTPGAPQLAPRGD